MNIQQAMRIMVPKPLKRINATSTQNILKKEKSENLQIITTKVNQLSKLSDYCLIEAERLIESLKKLKQKYDTVISNKGLSIVEYAEANIISKITTFTSSSKKIVISFDNSGKKTFKKYDLNNEITKSSRQKIQSQESAVSVENLLNTRKKVYYHKNSNKIETILNYDDNGNIISNQVYNKAGELVSQTSFSEAIPVLKTVYKNSQKKLTLEYNFFGSFKRAQEYDKNGNVVSIVEAVNKDLRQNLSKTSYIQTKFLDNGNVLKNEFDSKGDKLKHTVYNSTGDELEIVDFTCFSKNLSLTSEINILEFLKNP